jgi:hypothetical protein
MRTLAGFVACVPGPALVADTGAWSTYAWTSGVPGASRYRLGGGLTVVENPVATQLVLGLPRPA